MQKPAPPPATLSTQDILLRCPVGDYTNVSVWGFLVREMVEANKDDKGRAGTRALLARQAETMKRPTELKPPSASLVEGEIAHVLGKLCVGTAGCTGIGLYNRSGAAIALSSNPNQPLVGFGDDARWASLTDRGLAKGDIDDGGVFELTCEEATASGLPCDGRHRYAAFPVYEDAALQGLALCIVDVKP